MSTETSRLLPDRSPANDPKPNSHVLKILSLSAVVSIVVVVILYLYSRPVFKKDEGVKLIRGDNIQLMSEKYQFFLRTNKMGSLTLSEGIPWLHGSTFEQFRTESGCFALKSLIGSWLVLDRNTSIISPKPVDGLHATQFEVVYLDDSTNEGKKGKSATLKVCKEDLWWEVVEMASYLTVVARRAALDPTIRPHGSTDQLGNGALASVFRVHTVEPIHGVNLGGWFVPEIWMNPSFSNYTGLQWAGSLCK